MTTCWNLGFYLLENHLNLPLRNQHVACFCCCYTHWTTWMYASSIHFIDTSSHFKFYRGVEPIHRLGTFSRCLWDPKTSPQKGTRPQMEPNWWQNWTGSTWENLTARGESAILRVGTIPDQWMGGFQWQSRVFQQSRGSTNNTCHMHPHTSTL